MTTNNGGPAFPVQSDQYPQFNGMSLRDWFAGQASEPSSAWLERQRTLDRARNPHNDSYKPPQRDDFELIADWKYACADAMLESRE